MNRLHPNNGLVVVAAMLLIAVLPGQSCAAARTVFPVLMEPVDPRAMALGGALLTETGWNGGVLLNPAAAAGAGRSFGVNYAAHMVDMWSGRVIVSETVFTGYTLGGYVTTFSFGELDVSETGVGRTGEKFRAGENVFAVYGAGWLSGRIAWGGAFKFIRGDIDPYAASGMAIDLGLTFDPGWHDFRLGLVLRNWGEQLDGYGVGTDPLPTETMFGLSRKLAHLPLTLSTALIFTRRDEGEWEAGFLPGDPGFSFAVGGEFAVYSELLKDEFNLRFGYRSRGEGLRLGQENDLLAGTSFGIGIPIKRYRFEYAYATLGALGSIHRFGISGTL